MKLPGVYILGLSIPALLVGMSVGCKSLSNSQTQSIGVSNVTPSVKSFLPATRTNTPQPATMTPTVSPSPTALLPTETPTLTVAPPTATTVALAYFFPVQPPSSATFSRGHHDYPAVDIFAPEGTSFVAVTNGIVDYVSFVDSWNPGEDDPATRGGISVAIVGDDGVRYYGSHLSALAPEISAGNRVVAGQVLGAVGNSGNARHVAPHLHFGISHPTFPDDWKTRRGEIDPYPYLVSWVDGEMITPELPPN